ncbi:hypothetical protein DB31_7536 [Hyalangium minutum]|uniref:Uncharacterized protein n=1 Tax=Hyalangium minutum TaxID=394096 RepID=A0A085WKT6_9BACT|nr:hypothetical protein DB31_7536 [Hyalangium minutum]
MLSLPCLPPEYADRGASPRHEGASAQRSTDASSFGQFRHPERLPPSPSASDVRRVRAVDSDRVRWHRVRTGSRFNLRGGRCAMGTVQNGVSGRSTLTFA